MFFANAFLATSINVFYPFPSTASLALVQRSILFYNDLCATATEPLYLRSDSLKLVIVE